MHGDRGQIAQTVNRVSVDVVVAVTKYCAAGRDDSSTIPRDHGMRDQKISIPGRLQSEQIVAGDDIAQHDGGGRVAGQGERNDAGIAVPPEMGPPREQPLPALTRRVDPSS
jgi:hypothetical protein